jgi:hypothetical protein
MYHISEITLEFWELDLLMELNLDLEICHLEMLNCSLLRFAEITNQYGLNIIMVTANITRDTPDIIRVTSNIINKTQCLS